MAAQKLSSSSVVKNDMESNREKQSEREPPTEMREVHKEQNAASLSETKNEDMQRVFLEKVRAESDEEASADENGTSYCASSLAESGSEYSSSENAETDEDEVSTSEASRSISSASIESDDGESADSNSTTDQESLRSDSCSTPASDSVSEIWSATDNEESAEESDIGSEYKLGGAMKKRRVPESHHPNVISVETGYEADFEKRTVTEWRLEQFKKGPYVSRWVEEVNQALFPHLVEPQENKVDYDLKENEFALAKLTLPTNAKVSEAPKASPEIKTEAHATANSQITCRLQGDSLASMYDADNEDEDASSADESECDPLFRPRLKIDERGYEPGDDKPDYQRQRMLFRRWKEASVNLWVDDVQKRMSPNEDRLGQNIRGRLSRAWARFTTGARRVLGCCIGVLF